MKLRRSIILGLTAAILLSTACQCSPAQTVLPTKTPSQAINADTTLLPTAVQSTLAPGIPTEPRISESRLFSTLSDLTAIGADHGYRLAGTPGELAALTYIQQHLNGDDFLMSLKSDFELQEFHIPLATVFRSITVTLNINGTVLNIPANGLRGWADSTQEIMWLDSDGILNDYNQDPMVVQAAVVTIQSNADLTKLTSGSAKGKIVFINYSVMKGDPYNMRVSSSVEQKLASAQPAAIVLVTRNSNVVGEVHGTFSNEVGPIVEMRIPQIQVREEELTSNGSGGWRLLAEAQNASITWDTDVYEPGTSHNLVYRIPGKDSSRAMILSAHIDSVATPGALDDGSGSAILVEVADALNERHKQPDMDLYLVWFGSEEYGLYGSAHFVNTHQELMDRVVADLQIDCLSRPLEDVQAHIQLAFWPGNWDQPNASSWVNFISAQASAKGIETHKLILTVGSDNSNFDAYNVPNLDVLYDADDEMDSIGGVWYGGHLHDPYDNLQMAQDSKEPFLQMAQIALDAALLPSSTSGFRKIESWEYQAVFIGTHTEPSLMSPTGMADFAMLLAANGYKSTLIPYGTTFALTDLENADLVFVLPVADYPTTEGDLALYDESWTTEEKLALQQYADQGGLLVITNAATITGYYGDQIADNEDWDKMNSLSSIFGVVYTIPVGYESSADILADHALTNHMYQFELLEGDAVGFTIDQGQMLASIGNTGIAALIPYGEGEVLALADLGILSCGYNGLLNERFIFNLADYAASR